MKHKKTRERVGREWWKKTSSCVMWKFKNNLEHTHTSCSGYVKMCDSMIIWISNWRPAFMWSLDTDLAWSCQCCIKMSLHIEIKSALCKTHWCWGFEWWRVGSLPTNGSSGWLPSGRYSWPHPWARWPPKTRTKSRVTEFMWIFFKGCTRS